MRSKSYMLPASVAFLVLGIASSLVAQEVQEVSHQVNVQASHINVRKTGEAVLANSSRSRAEASVSRELTRVGNESLFSKMHSEAHHWGRVMAQKRRVSQPCSRRVYLPSRPCR